MANLNGPSFYPGALKVKKVTFGVASNVSTDKGDVAIDVSTGFASASNTLFTVKAGTIVHDLMVNIRTEFGSTGAAVMTMGDTDVDGFLVASDLIASDAGMKSMLGTPGSTGGAHGSAYAGGRVYTSDDTLAIGFKVADHKINAGLGDAYLFYFDTGEV